MSRKGSYSVEDIKRVNVAALVAAAVAGCTVAIDVAKEKFVFAIAAATGDVLKIIRFKHPTETRLLLDLLRELAAVAKSLRVLMEPTGTYGDSLRDRLAVNGHAVYKIQPKHTHDAKELLDGVPSKHDAKDAVTMLMVDRTRPGSLWRPLDDLRRAGAALMHRCEMHARDAERRYGHLEAMMARHWPELAMWLDVRSHVSARALLRAYQCPAAVAADIAGAENLLQRASRGGLSAILIAGVVESAKDSLGVPMVQAEREMMRELIDEIERHEASSDALETEINDAMRDNPVYERMAGAAGPATAAAIMTLLGSPKDYTCSRAFLKAAGLNLREHSSGTQQSGLSLTKRGPSLVRKLLYMTALRSIASDPIVRAWYEGRACYQQQNKTAAVVAVMRKLLAGLFHVAKHGVEFDTRKLFDTRRLAIKEIERRGKPFAKRTTPRSTIRRAQRTPRSAAAHGGAHP